MKFSLNRLLVSSVAVGAALVLTVQTASAWNGGSHRTSEREDAMGITPDIENGKKLYQLCARCHQDTGWGIEAGFGKHGGNGYYPVLAGQHKNVLIKQLSDIRSGNRDNPMMYPFTLDKYIGGPKDIADVTAYISTMKQNPNHEVGFGNDLAHGERLYKDNCASCHGDNGEGSNVDYYPRLQGQHYTYMLRQMKWIKNGKRRNANSKMVKQIEGFSFRDMKAVIDYTSRLKPAVNETTE
jgi:cytochrome c553